MQVQILNGTGAKPQEVFIGGAPPGDKAYKCVITSSGIEPNKDGDGQNWVVKATVVEGQEQGSVCQAYCGMPKGDNKDPGRISKIGGMLVALGLRSETQVVTNFAFDTEEAVNKPCVVYVTEKGTNKAGQRDTEQTFVWPTNWNAALSGAWNPKDAAKNAGQHRAPQAPHPGTSMSPPGQPINPPPAPNFAPQQQQQQQGWAPPQGQQAPQGWAPPQQFTPQQ